MTMRKYGDVMASVGEYQDDQGRKAKRWLKCGVVMKDDTSGKLSIKLDAVPVRPDWSGWLAVRHVNDNGDNNGQT
jgi:hypothetical protein